MTVVHLSEDINVWTIGHLDVYTIKYQLNLKSKPCIPAILFTWMAVIQYKDAGVKKGNVRYISQDLDKIFTSLETDNVWSR